MRKRRALRGFTLLEVMVATAILGLGLTAILSAQAGAFATAAHARNLSVATTLARCKMGEIEERLSEPEGMPELEEIDSGPCCEGDETPNLRCTWKIEKPQFPEPKLGELDLDTGLDLSTPAGGTSSASGGAAGGLGPLGAMLGMPGGDPSSAMSALGDSSGGLGDIAGAMGAAGGMEALGGMLQLVGTFVYPQLKMIYETNARRITLTVTWTEGSREYSFDVVQWYVNPQPSLPTNELVDAASGGGLPGMPDLSGQGNTGAPGGGGGRPPSMFPGFGGPGMGGPGMGGIRPGGGMR
ncbi:MAG: type II secretion system protein [Polyangiaceae bacterium]|nr:type II secretion system protein [Polyangiaceae bacterium]